MARRFRWHAYARRFIALLLVFAFEANGRAQSVPPTQRANLSNDAYTVVSGNTQFAVNLYKEVAANSNANANMLVSPFSISSALTMTYAGAAGQTAQQMAGVLNLHLPKDRLNPAYGELLSDLTTPRDAYQLNIANRLFGQSGYTFKQPFLGITADDYQAPVEPTDFSGDPEGSRQHINQWVADQTHDKIQDLLPPGGVSANTRLVLTNAIYFNGKWKYKFDESATAMQPFHSADGTSAPAATMFQESTLRYGKFNGYQMLEMPYAGDDLSMVVILPTAPNGLANLESSLTATNLTWNLFALTSKKVDVYLPKFKFDASFALGGVLEAMGMTDAFTDRADFSGISNQGLKISSVVHKAFIDVNEDGTEAAAATGIGFSDFFACIGCSAPQVFNADHPFLFALRDTHSGSLLFMGPVMQPGDASISSLVGPVVPEPRSLLLLAIGIGVSSIGRLLLPFRRRCVPAL
jgi:serine protease inhibitor